MGWHQRIYAFNLYNRDQWVAKQAKDIAAGSRILDAGAGAGRYRSLFHHCEYRAQDFGQEPGTLGKYTKLDYQSDITNIPVPDGSFDVILCTEVLEHVPEPIKAIGEFSRILKTGGRLLLTAPLGSFLHQEPFHYYGDIRLTGMISFCLKPVFGWNGSKRTAVFFCFFGQEAVRFSALIDPRRTWRAGWSWPLLTLLWLVTLPVLRGLFPLIGRSLDGRQLEKAATVGYHVSAIKTDSKMD
jgi:SAM-dependent methyltransferase